MVRREPEEDFEFEGRIQVTTGKAYLVDPTMGEEVWVPKSQVVNMEEVAKGLFVFRVTGWWYNKPDNKAKFK